MEIKTKQRMIGILIVLIILLVLTPLLFSNSKQSTVNEPVTEQVLTSSAPQAETNFEQQQPVPAEQAQIVENQVPAVEQTSVGENQLPSTEQAAPLHMQSTPVIEALPTETKLEGLVEQSDTKPQVENVGVVPSEQAVVAPVKSEQVSPKITKPVKATKKVSANKKATQVKNWSIRLGTFSKKNNATNLLNKLNGSGFKARSKETFISGKRVYQVIAGPYDQDKAKRTLATLDKNYHLKGVLVHS